MKFCRNNEADIINDKIFSAFKNEYMKSFWRDIRKVKSAKKIISSIVDESNNDQDIVENFRNKFSKILNNDVSKRRETILDEHITRIISNRYVFRITMHEMTASIGKLNNMNDPDQVHSNHFKYASHDFACLIFLFFLFVFVACSHF